MLKNFVRQLLRRQHWEDRIPSLPEDVYQRDKDLLKQSFYFEGSKKTALLFIHGWTSTPYEFRDLGMFLHKRGYTVYAPLLSGHGTCPNDLKDITLEQWMEDVRIAFRKLAKSHDRVLVGGSSFGGTLSALLTAEEKDVSGLILIGTPYRLKGEWMLRVMARIFLLLRRKHQRKAYVKTWNALLEEHRCISYRWYPVKSGLEVLRGVLMSRKKFPLIHVPTFIFQSRYDHVIDASSIEEIEQSLSSKYTRKHKINKKIHTFIVDKELRDRLYPDVYQFLEEGIYS